MTLGHRTGARWFATVAMFLGTSVVWMAGGSPVSAASGFTALGAPQRLLDTRPGKTTADGQFAGGDARPAGSTLELQVSGRSGLPAQMAAVVLNVTVATPAAAGHVTVFPCDQPRPTAANLNYSAGQASGNAVITALDGAGRTCLFTSASTQLIVDAAGSFPVGAFEPLPAPQRLLDTRPGNITADGQFQAGGIRPAGSVLALKVTDRVGVPANATAVALNVAAVAPIAAGFVTAFPCGATQPTTSSLNYVAGKTIPNLVISSIGTNGSVCLFVSAGTHLVVDVGGMLPAATFQALPAPQRLLDSRPGKQTVDGGFVGSGIEPGGGTLQLKVAGRGSIPANASAVVLNVTTVGSSANGFVTVHPNGSSRPTASNLNYQKGDVLANTVIARVGRGGDVCLFTLSDTHLVVDIAGWLTGPAPATTGSQCPSLEPTDPNTRNQLVVRPTLHGIAGVDRIAVLACDVPDDGNGTLTVDPAAIATWANQTVAPWFVATSLGAYQPVFEAHPLGRISGSGPSDCSNGAEAATSAPFTNVLVVDTSTYGGGFAGPGSISSNPAFDVSALSQSPRVSRRGGWVGGGVALINPAVVIHEIGHTVHWPHSYIGPFDEYDNPVDIMSGEPVDFFAAYPDLSRFCPGVDAGTYIWCRPQNTLAFNRLAAGWMTGTQVAVHRSGRVNYTLDKPTGAGVQMVALPNASAPARMLTLEARPAIGYDEDLVKPGVAVHIVDQGDGSFNSISTQRRQRQATGQPNSYDHVVAPGGSLTVDGVTISVIATVGNGYQVTVVGSYVGGAVPFTQSTVTRTSCAAAFTSGTCWK
jgi:hypothetical protein